MAGYSLNLERRTSKSKVMGMESAEMTCEARLGYGGRHRRRSGVLFFDGYYGLTKVLYDFKLDFSTPVLGSEENMGSQTGEARTVDKRNYEF